MMNVPAGTMSIGIWSVSRMISAGNSSEPGKGVGSGEGVMVGVAVGGSVVGSGVGISAVADGFSTTVVGRIVGVGSGAVEAGRVGSAVGSGRVGSAVLVGSSATAGCSGSPWLVAII